MLGTSLGRFVRASYGCFNFSSMLLEIRRRLREANQCPKKQQVPETVADFEQDEQQIWTS